MTLICVSKLTIIIIVSNNGLSTGRRQATIWTNAGLLLIGQLGTNFMEILIEISIFSLKKCIWKCRQEMCAQFVSDVMMILWHWYQSVTIYALSSIRDTRNYYSDVIMSTMASNHQRLDCLPVTRKIFSFDDVIMSAGAQKGIGWLESKWQLKWFN